jgi:hypothetical protein
MIPSQIPIQTPSLSAAELLSLPISSPQYCMLPLDLLLQLDLVGRTITCWTNICSYCLELLAFSVRFCNDSFFNRYFVSSFLLFQSHWSDPNQKVKTNPHNLVEQAFGVALQRWIQRTSQEISELQHRISQGDLESNEFEGNLRSSIQVLDELIHLKFFLLFFQISFPSIPCEFWICKFRKGMDDCVMVA